MATDGIDTAPFAPGITAATKGQGAALGDIVPAHRDANQCELRLLGIDAAALAPGITAVICDAATSCVVLDGGRL
jgi:hypothetical protein